MDETCLFLEEETGLNLMDTDFDSSDWFSLEEHVGNCRENYPVSLASDLKGEKST